MKALVPITWLPFSRFPALLLIFKLFAFILNRIFEDELRTYSGDDPLDVWYRWANLNFYGTEALIRILKPKYAETHVLHIIVGLVDKNSFTFTFWYRDSSP